MNLLLNRDKYDDQSTIGELHVDDDFQCFVLEDRVRAPGVKVFGKTAIPAGVYNVELTYSNRFGKVMPLIDAVPGFDGVRIHAGNTAKDTEGCLLVGLSQGNDFIGSSVAAFNDLFPQLKHAKDMGDVITLTIIDNVPEDFDL